MFLEKCEVPRKRDYGVYREMIEEFVASGDECAKVVLGEGDKPSKTVYFGLREQNKRLGYIVKVSYLNETVYLVRR